ncbi:hypothetical protein LB506_009263 [Fusarium annulatum]|nr:hypothetical protein LB506_009263 [Fusarium annulatum]
MLVSLLTDSRHLMICVCLSENDDASPKPPRDPETPEKTHPQLPRTWTLRSQPLTTAPSNLSDEIRTPLLAGS